APHQVQTLRIVLASIQEFLQGVTRVAVLSGSDVARANLAPDFILCVELIALHNFFEMADCFGESVLSARDPAKLIVRVQLIPVDFDGALKALARLVQFAAILMNQSQIVMRRGIARINGCRLEIFFEGSARALLAHDAPEISAQ